MNTDTYNYKHIHEQYMQNLNGTTATEVVLVILPGPLGIFLTTFLCRFCIHYVTIQNRMSSSVPFLLDFLTLIVPLVMCFTILSNIHHFITVMFSLVIIFCFSYCCVMNRRRMVLSQTFISQVLQTPILESKRCFITNFRAIMNLMTAICILAVDFRVFPRRYAKTETFGYGLMDIGVGLFVISNAIIAPQALRRKDKIEKFTFSMWKAIKSSIPLLLLGCTRLFVTQQIDYQAHISEYGVHWNFFMTLAVTKIVCTLILQFLGSDYSVMFPVGLITLHEFLLQCGIQEWVMSDVGRENVLTANREGISSSLGYVALYFAGICLGKELHNYKCSFQTDLRLIRKLAFISFVMWSLTFLFNVVFGVSRRLANIGYFTWIVAFSTVVLAILLFIELLTRLLNKVMNTEMRTEMRTEVSNVSSYNIKYVPLTLDAINYNGLLFFLLANVFTGLINIYVQTLTVGIFQSLSIICGYCFLICSIAVFLYFKKIKLKM